MKINQRSMRTKETKTEINCYLNEIENIFSFSQEAVTIDKN
jgi:hypothetical protein